jgi:hypothetical protein
MKTGDVTISGAVNYAGNMFWPKEAKVYDIVKGVWFDFH